MQAKQLLAALWRLLLGYFRAQPVPAVPPDAGIQRILAERIDVHHQGVGIVVGVIDSQGRRVVSHGSTSIASPRPVDGDTVFEIGSTTKVFTALLLADAVRRGELALTEPVSRYLPPDVKVPALAGKQITLQDLSTHTSGLPSLPSNLDLTNPPDAGPSRDRLAQRRHWRLPLLLRLRSEAAHRRRAVEHVHRSRCGRYRRSSAPLVNPAAEVPEGGRGRSRDLRPLCGPVEFDAQITFESERQQRAARLVLHQGGVDRPAKRIE